MGSLEQYDSVKEAGFVWTVYMCMCMRIYMYMRTCMCRRLPHPESDCLPQTAYCRPPPRVPRRLRPSSPTLPSAPPSPPPHLAQPCRRRPQRRALPRRRHRTVQRQHHTARAARRALVGEGALRCEPVVQHVDLTDACVERRQQGTLRSQGRPAIGTCDSRCCFTHSDLLCVLLR